MKDVTLKSVNWNQRQVMELMLKSYVEFHYKGEPLNLLLVDNGSEDDSKQWLWDNGIPFGDFPVNIWHEPVLNHIYLMTKTRYELLVDTDIEFLADVSHYLDHMQGRCKSVGELCNVGHERMKERISPWFWLYDHRAMVEEGVLVHKNGNYPWIYDVGAPYWEYMKALGFTNHHVPGSGDADCGLGMFYGTHRHFGKLSWDTGHHTERVGEIAVRKRYVVERLKNFEHIDLKGKFVSPIEWPVYTDEDMHRLNPDVAAYNMSRGWDRNGRKK